MGMIVKDYLTHTNVQFLFLALFASLAAISELAVWEHWPWLVLVVVSAPFYEWVTHKFVLHGALSPVPGRWRDYQIRLHHGHHLDPADRAAICSGQRYFNHDGTALSVLCAGVLEHYCGTGALASSIAYYLFYESGFIWPITRQPIARARAWA